MPLLRDLDVQEVSLVNKGANNRKFLIFKSEEKGVNEDMAKAKETVKKQIEGVDIPEISVGAQNAIIGALKMLQEYKEELPMDVFDMLAGIMEETGRLENVPNVGEEEDDDDGGEEEMEMNKALEKLPDDIKKNFDSIMKANERQSEEIKVLKSLVQKAEDEKLLGQFVEMAKSYENLSVEPNEFGKILKDISINAPDALKDLEKVLKSADEMIKKSKMFEEIGTSSDGVGSAWDKIEKSADEIEKTEKVSRAVAISKAIEVNPKLYDEYLKEGGQI